MIIISVKLTKHLYNYFIFIDRIFIVSTKVLVNYYYSNILDNYLHYDIIIIAKKTNY